MVKKRYKYLVTGGMHTGGKHTGKKPTEKSTFGYLPTRIHAHWDTCTFGYLHTRSIAHRSFAHYLGNKAIVFLSFLGMWG